MLKLIRLELRKNKLSPYLWTALWFFFMNLGFCFLFGLIPKLEAIDGMVPTDLIIIQEWGTFLTFVSIISAMAFGILSAVMHTKFTVEEYTGKHAVLLFSYPQSRGKILLAKSGLVFVFTVCFNFVCQVAAICLFGFFSNTFGILPESFGLWLLPTLLSVSGVFSVLSASIGLVAMRVGFWKKSLVATVVAAVILIAPFGNIVSFLPQYSAFIHFAGMIILLLAGLMILIQLMWKVNKMEAV